MGRFVARSLVSSCHGKQLLPSLAGRWNNHSGKRNSAWLAVCLLYPLDTLLT